MAAGLVHRSLGHHPRKYGIPRLRWGRPSAKSPALHDGVATLGISQSLWMLMAISANKYVILSRGLSKSDLPAFQQLGGLDASNRRTGIRRHGGLSHDDPSTTRLFSLSDVQSSCDRSRQSCIALAHCHPGQGPDSCRRPNTGSFEFACRGPTFLQGKAQGVQVDDSCIYGPSRLVCSTALLWSATGGTNARCQLAGGADWQSEHARGLRLWSLRARGAFVAGPASLHSTVSPARADGCPERHPGSFVDFAR